MKHDHYFQKLPSYGIMPLQGTVTVAFGITA